MPALRLSHLGDLSNLKDVVRVVLLTVRVMMVKLVVHHGAWRGRLQLGWGDLDYTLLALLIGTEVIHDNPFIAKVGHIHMHFTGGCISLCTSNGYHGWLRHVHIRFIIYSLEV